MPSISSHNFIIINQLGQYPLSCRLEEILNAVDEGATEIDVVIDRSLVLTGQWEKLYNEIFQMRSMCGEYIHMKVILAIGECGTMDNVYKASMVAMMAGADFIKTSTGKEGVNATLPVGLVMIRAIKEFYQLTKKKIGLKPAGGVRTVREAIEWMMLIKSTLGDEWLQPSLFRFGASGLLDDIERKVKITFDELTKADEHRNNWMKHIIILYVNLISFVWFFDFSDTKKYRIFQKIKIFFFRFECSFVFYP